MLKRKAFWLLLASGVLLPFDCIPSVPHVLNQLNPLNNPLFTQLAARIPALQSILTLLNRLPHL
jgi:hypothetical protein